MQKQLMLWNRLLRENESSAKLRSAIFLNYDELGPIPSEIRIQVWLALIGDKEKCKVIQNSGVYEVIEQSFEYMLKK